MSKKNWIAGSLALACGLFSMGAAHASLTVYTSRAAFNAALVAPTVDSYDDLVLGAGYQSPLNRTGVYGYTATASGVSGFIGVGTSTDSWLSALENQASITLDSFTGGVAGVGANFFITDINGDFTADGMFTVAATDADGTTTQSFSVSSLSNFVGFISSTGSVTSVLITNEQTGNTNDSSRFLTLNDLALGASPAALPEPTTPALVLAALALGGLASTSARRRKA